MISYYQPNVEVADKYESLSVLYWEKDNIAMCADMSTGDEYCDINVRKMAKKYDSIEYILQDGNNNSPNSIINHNSLSPEKRLELIDFMHGHILEYYFKNNRGLEDFATEQKAFLEAKYHSLIG